jgi:hypothetical protein
MACGVSEIARQPRLGALDAGRQLAVAKIISGL